MSRIRARGEAAGRGKESHGLMDEEMISDLVSGFPAKETGRRRRRINAVSFFLCWKYEYSVGSRLIPNPSGCLSDWSDKMYCACIYVHLLLRSNSFVVQIYLRAYTNLPPIYVICFIVFPTCVGRICRSSTFWVHSSACRPSCSSLTKKAWNP